jgi:hypothetical protein
VQLNDVATGSHVWAERYDRDLADVFAVQDEITEAIVASYALVTDGRAAPCRKKVGFPAEARSGRYLECAPATKRAARPGTRRSAFVTAP